MESIEEEAGIMESIEEEAAIIALDLLPEKSNAQYIKTYDIFLAWKEEKRIDKDSFSEAVLLVYFRKLKDKYAPSSLWCFYSMLRSVIQRNHNIDIKYPKLMAFLKKSMDGIGYEPKQSLVFQSHEISRFLIEAPDKEFLAVKVVMVFGLYGGTRADELTKVLNDHIQLFKTKTKIDRMFTVEGEYAIIIRKYKALRSLCSTTSRFFVKYVNGKCFDQPMGRNKFLSIPKLIAEFLNLPNPEKYTGHNFRRTGTTVLADAGADMRQLKQFGGWTTNTTVERYIDNSVNNKRKIDNMIANEINLSAKNRANTKSIVTSTITSSQIVKINPSSWSGIEHQPSTSSQTEEQLCSQTKRSKTKPLNENSKHQGFMNVSNCTINMHFNN